jgi:hypothetical protein
MLNTICAFCFGVERGFTFRVVGKPIPFRSHPGDAPPENRRLSGVAASTSNFRDFEDETSGFPAGRKGFPTLWNPSPAPAGGDDVTLNSRRATPAPLGEGTASGVSHGTHGNAPQQTLGLAPLWQRMILAALWPEGFVGQAETAVKVQPFMP